MDIPLVSSAPTAATQAVSRIVPDPVSPLVQAQTVSALLAQTTVDLSPMGRFFAAIALFQKRLLEQQSNATVPTEAESEQAIAEVANALVAVADSANALQASSLTGTSDDQQLATLFGQQFAALTQNDSDTLAEIGLTFAPPDQLEGNVLEVDTEALLAAFEDDPAATVALLDQTAAAFAALAGITAAADPSALPAALELSGTEAVAAPQTFPDLEALPAAVASEDGFLQELLAETARPTVAQAAPPSVTEAAANFAAPRAADTDGEAIASVVAPALAEAQQLQAAQDAARAANSRFIDTISAEREANERLASAAATERADEIAQREQLAVAQADAARIKALNDEERRVALVGEQLRINRALEGRELTGDERDLATPGRQRVSIAAQPEVQAAPLAAAATPPPLQAAGNNAQQLARDPATMAAIAAYNLSAGPFAALHGRPEIAAQRPKIVPAVETVTRISAIEADAATSEFSRPSR